MDRSNLPNLVPSSSRVVFDIISIDIFFSIQEKLSKITNLHNWHRDHKYSNLEFTKDMHVFVSKNCQPGN